MHDRPPTSSLFNFKTALAGPRLKRIHHGLASSLVVLLAFSLTACSTTEVSLDRSTPADALEKTLAELRPAPATLATEFTLTSSVMGDIEQAYQTESIHHIKMYAEPERLGISVDSDYYRLLPNRYRTQSQHSQMLIKNQNELRYSSDNGHRSIQSSATDDESVRKTRAIWSGYEFINGYMPTKGVHITDMLAEATHVEWINDPGLSDGSDNTASRVLRAESDYGVFTFWFDETSDAHPIKIMREVSGTDLLTSKPVNALPVQPRMKPEWKPKYPQEALKQVVFTVNFDNFKHIDGQYIPMAGSFREDRTYASGKKLTFNRSLNRTRYEMTPLFTDDTFVLDAPDGTGVVIEGKRPINHVWENGGIRELKPGEKLARIHPN